MQRRRSDNACAKSYPDYRKRRWIATTHCGAAELFTPDQDLIVVPAQDAEQLGTAMQRLYSSDETRHRLRTNALRSLQQIEGDGAYRLYSNTLDRILELVERGK